MTKQSLKIFVLNQRLGETSLIWINCTTSATKNQSQNVIKMIVKIHLKVFFYIYSLVSFWRVRQGFRHMLWQGDLSVLSGTELWGLLLMYCTFYNFSLLFQHWTCSSSGDPEPLNFKLKFHLEVGLVEQPYFELFFSAWSIFSSYKRSLLNEPDFTLFYICCNFGHICCTVENLGH